MDGFFPASGGEPPFWVLPVLDPGSMAGASQNGERQAAESSACNAAEDRHGYWDGDGNGDGERHGHATDYGGGGGAGQEHGDLRRENELDPFNLPAREGGAEFSNLTPGDAAFADLEFPDALLPPGDLLSLAEYPNATDWAKGNNTDVGDPLTLPGGGHPDASDWATADEDLFASLGDLSDVLQEGTLSFPHENAPPAEVVFQDRSTMAEGIFQQETLAVAHENALSSEGSFQASSVTISPGFDPSAPRLCQQEAGASAPGDLAPPSDPGAPGPPPGPNGARAPCAPSAPVSAVRERLWNLMERDAAAEAAAAAKAAASAEAPAAAEAEASAETKGGQEGRWVWVQGSGSGDPHPFSSIQQEVLLATDSLIWGPPLPASLLLQPEDPARRPPQALPQTFPTPPTLHPPKSKMPSLPVAVGGKGSSSLPQQSPVPMGHAAGSQRSQGASRKEQQPSSAAEAAGNKPSSSLADRLAALLDGIQGPEEEGAGSEPGRASLLGSASSQGTDSRGGSRNNRGAAGAAGRAVLPASGAPRPGATFLSTAGLAPERHTQGTAEAPLNSIALLGARKRRAVQWHAGSMPGPERGAEGSWRVECLEEEEEEAELACVPPSFSASEGLGQGRQGHIGALVPAGALRAMPSLHSAWHGSSRKLLHPFFKKQVYDQLMRLATAYSAGEHKTSANKQLVQLKRVASPVGNVTERFVHYMLTALQGRFTAESVPVTMEAGAGVSLVNAAQDSIRHVWGGLSETAMAQALIPALLGQERVHILVLTMIAVPDWPTLFNALTAATGPTGSPGAQGVQGGRGTRGGVGATGGAGRGGGAGGPGGGGARRRLKSMRVTFMIPDIGPATESRGREDYRALCLQVVAAGAARGVPVEASIRFLPSIDFTLPPDALDPNETLVAASWLTLQILPDDAVLRHNPRNTFLKWLRSVGARALVIVDIDADFNIQFFLPRFEAILRSAQVVFECFDEILQYQVPMVGPGGPRGTFALERLSALNLMNCAACDGLQRYERAESMARWRERLRGVGFVEAAFSGACRRDLAILLPHPRSSLLDVQGFLSLRWDDKPLLFVGAWT